MFCAFWRHWSWFLQTPTAHVSLAVACSFLFCSTLVAVVDSNGGAYFATPETNNNNNCQVIYDVDDDNALIHPEAGVPHALSPFTPGSTTSFAVGPEASVHNPYGCFGGPGNVWPRGFPLDSINDADSNRCDEVAVDPAGENAPPEEGWRLGVVQALANHDPDVDAVYRLTYPPGGLPFDFQVPDPVPEGMSSLKIVPPAAFTPYNAQVISGVFLRCDFV